MQKCAYEVIWTLNLIFKQAGYNKVSIKLRPIGLHSDTVQHVTITFTDVTDLMPIVWVERSNLKTVSIGIGT